MSVVLYSLIQLRDAPHKNLNNNYLLATQFSTLGHLNQIVRKLMLKYAAV